MDFWGVDVESGKTVLVFPAEFRVIHITQIALQGATTEELIHLKLKMGDSTFTVASLSAAKIPQVSCHVVFDREFELFHDGNVGTVRLRGYTEENFVDYAAVDYDNYLSIQTYENPVSDAKCSGDKPITSAEPKAKSRRKERSSQSARETPVSAKKPKLAPRKSDFSGGCAGTSNKGRREKALSPRDSDEKLQSNSKHGAAAQVCSSTSI